MPSIGIAFRYARNRMKKGTHRRTSERATESIVVAPTQSQRSYYRHRILEETVLFCGLGLSADNATNGTVSRRGVTYVNLYSKTSDSRRPSFRGCM